MEKYKKYFTHERLNNKFQNNFDLTNYAIKLAKLNIKEGEQKSLGQIMKELEDLPDIEKEQEEGLYA